MSDNNLPFSYQYKDKQFHSSVDLRIRGGGFSYVVALPDGAKIEMEPIPCKMPGGIRKRWLQSLFVWESGQPDDLVQAMGEGLERVLDLP